MKASTRTDLSLIPTAVDSIAIIPTCCASFLCLLLTVLLCPHLSAQSKKVVWLKAPNGRTYKTICTAGHCDVEEATHDINLVDPH